MTSKAHAGKFIGLREADDKWHQTCRLDIPRWNLSKLQLGRDRSLPTDLDIDAAGRRPMALSMGSLNPCAVIRWLVMVCVPRAVTVEVLLV